MSEVASFRALGDVTETLVRSLRIELDKNNQSVRQQSQKKR